MNTAGFEIIKELGRGGMASVYLAKQTSLNREVALKIMSPALSVDADFKQRFLKEGQLIAQLNHPHVVTVYDIGFAAKRYYIAMEYLGSGSLKDEIRKGMEVALAIRVAKQVAQALGYAHRKGIVHRDVKPLNILFREPGESVLTDFGIAKVTAGDTQLTRTGMLVGTPSYMSPEQARGEKLDGRSDLYSLGVVLYEMLTGERPYDTEDSFSTALKHLTAPIPRLPAKLEFMQPVIDRLMAKDRADRYADEAELVAHLEHIEREISLDTQMYARPTARESSADTLVSKSGTGSSPGSWFGTGPRPAGATGPSTTVSVTLNWRPILLSGLLLTLLLGGGAAYWLLGSGPDLDPKTERIVQLLLDRAEQQVSEERFVQPEDNNAVQTYREILQIVPDYKPARDGLKGIADRLEQLARAQHGRGEIEQCLETIDKGLAAVPGHPGLIGLQTLVLKQQALDQLFLMAERQMAAEHYIEPEGDNAVETFRKVLTISPEHPRAVEGLEKVLGWMARRAKEQLEAGDYPGVETLVAQGMEIDPDHAELRQIGEQAAQRLQQRERRQRIDTLLAQAQTQLDDGRTLEPAGDNALETFREVLALDPDSGPARQGEASIREQLLKEILDSIQDDQLDKASTLLQQGKRAFPNDVKLVAAEQVFDQRQALLRKQERLAELLDTARQRQSQGQYTTPEGASALQAYREMLSLDADNADAEKGMQQIARHFLAQAQKAREQKALSEAIEAVNDGLKAVPDEERLLELKDLLQADLRKERESEQLRLRIAELLQRADAQLENNRLSRPEGDNALQTYRQVLLLDEGNDQARQGVDRVVARYRTLAQQMATGGRLAEAIALADESLQAFPDNQTLVDLKARLEIQAEDAAQQRRIDEAMAAVRALLRKDNVSRAEADQAYAHLQRVRKSEPNNSEVRDGVARLKAILQAQARDQLTAGNYGAARDLAEYALGLEPALEPVQSELRATLGRIADGQNEAERARRVEELLAQAEAHIKAGRLGDPDSGNAYDGYQQVLELDGRNPRALDGLAQVAKAYADAAAAQLEDNRFDQSLALLDRALELFPGNSGLSALKGRVERERSAAVDRNKIDGLLREAERQMAANRLLFPVGDNAHETYKQILNLDPNNADALKGIERIGESYLELARRDQAEGDLDQAAEMVQRGLSVVPGNARLMAAQAEIREARAEREQQRDLARQKAREEQARREALAEQKRREEAAQRAAAAEQRQRESAGRIASLLDKADADYKSQRFAQARRGYQQVVGLDRNNRRASKGLRRIAERYYEMARRQRTADQLDKALEAAEKGLEAQPGHARLTALSRDIQAEQRQKAAEALRARQEEEQRRLAAEAAAREAELARQKAEEQKQEEDKKSWKPRVFGTF